MGGASSTTYASPITNNKKPGETEIYRSSSLKDLVAFPNNNPKLNSIQAILLYASSIFGKKNCLGTKDAQKVYQWKSYEQCVNLATRLGSGIMRRELAPSIKEFLDHELKFVAIFSKNCEEYVILDMACSLYGVVAVPIYDTLGPQAMVFILEQTNLTTIFLSSQNLEGLLKIGKPIGKVKNLVCFDAFTEENSKAAEALGWNLMKYSEILTEENSVEPYPTIDSDTIYTFSYTSGTTGNPKGVMLSHGNIVSVAACLEYTDFGITENDIHLSYLPLAHVFERVIINAFLLKGSSIGFYSGDVQKLKEDLATLKPTFFASVPRLYNRFYEVITSNIKKLKGMKRMLADRAIASKLYYLKNGAYYKYKLYDRLVFNRMKEAFGGRVKSMVTASAPISQEVHDFLKIACSCPILEGYGQTESTGASFCTKASDPVSGHVGGPTSNTEFKLLDVPEMNYTSKDKDEDGNPLPRGELLIRGYGVFKGYYKDEEKTKEALNSEGWLLTGDIVQLNQNGSIKIIDRKKNIFKLAQGEYVAAEKIEICYNKSDAVEEIFVYGDSLQAFLVGVVFPKRPFVLEAGKKLGLEGTFEELITKKEIEKEILENMNKQAKADKLLGFEMVKKFKLIPDSFALKGLVTSTFKLKRHEAKLMFAEDIKVLYSA